ncbi:MAG: tubulin-like doman-containing protein, partial [Planctomycetota bacterium]|nr:tubulin-like doman-containing protein [Planctomycetota bacterium]
LDYICEHYSLQHLDVKPENLLLLGGHTKVGDFGLVKQVQDKTLSLMGGLTPVYASPEIFDGRPSLQSDQYSLAIVYQEMLTSALPFPGRTPAQLAIQHASAEPRLGPLPSNEQATIARALAKNPQDRFPNCRAMVESLADTSPSDINKKPAPADPPKRDVCMTAPVDLSAVNRKHNPISKPAPTATIPTVALERGTTDPPQRPKPSGWSVTEALEPAPRIEDLPPLQVLSREQRLQPVLLLGIGGTGARVLRKLRGRLSDRYGDVDIPSIRMLLLDTDPSDINSATSGNPRTALSAEETLALPLRRPREYRSRAQEHLSWLSRRWLYNIPRSLKTQGLRPLGRLALVDHATDVLDRLRQELSAATDSQALAQSADAMGIAPGDRAPRVYIVASISGGTGSGMVLDVAAMARKVLAELDLSDDHLLGMLMHSTGHKPDEHDMAMANTYACLSELHHYHREKHYPGNTACQLPATREDTPTFRHTYLFPLGEKLDEQQFDTATDAVAEYLYLDSVTPAGLFFDSHRAEEENAGSAGWDPSDPVHLRTFGLARIGCSSGDLPVLAADSVCSRVVALWQGDSSADDSETEQAAEQVADELRLGLRGYVVQAVKTVHHELAPQAEITFPDQLTEHDDGASATWMLLLHALEELASRHNSDPDSYEIPDSLAEALERSLDAMAAKQGVAAAEWIMQWANESSAGTAAARRGGSWFAKHLQSLEFDLRQLLGMVKMQTEQVEQQSKNSGNTLTRSASKAKKPPPKKPTKGWLRFNKHSDKAENLRLRHYSLRLARIVLEQVDKALRIVRQHTVAAGDRLGDLSHTLNLLADQFPHDDRLKQMAAEANAENAENPQTDALQQPVATAIQSQIGSLAAAVDRQLRRGPLAEKGIWEITARQHDQLKQLTDELRKNSRAAVLYALKQFSVEQLSHTRDGNHPDETNRTSDALQNAQPALISCGGAR